MTYVDVEPNVVFFAYVGDGVDGVERPVDGRTGGAIHKEGQMTFALMSDDQFFQFGRNHPTAFIAGHLNAVLGAQTDGRGAPGHRIMVLQWKHYYSKVSI